MTERLSGTKKRHLQCLALIALSFFLTSSGYLSWLYHLMTFVSSRTADLLSLTWGYLAQAAGVLLFAILIRFRRDVVGRRLFAGLLALFLCCLIPAAFSSSLAGTVLFGILLNLCCGLIAGYYLHALGLYCEASFRGGAFGLGYAVSILLSWLVSLPADGCLLRTGLSLVLCLVTAVLCFLLSAYPKTAERTREDPETSVPCTDSHSGIREDRLSDRSVLFTGITLLMICLVKSLGFGFPSSDINSGLSLEFSRLVYAAGLIAAGFVNDKSRKYGAICTFAALVTPFLMLTLARESVPHILLWNLDYLIYGFFSVYRIILFTDLADRQGDPAFACLGLMIGRLGDALGNLIFHMSGRNTLVLILIACILFTITVFQFLRMYQMLYIPAAVQKKTDREIFEHFAVRHDLSAREKEVLRYLLEGRTNAEIAEKLFVSESTVKFHVHNLLQKTGSSGRAQLRAHYLEQK